MQAAGPTGVSSTTRHAWHEILARHGGDVDARLDDVAEVGAGGGQLAAQVREALQRLGGDAAVDDPALLVDRARAGAVDSRPPSVTIACA